ncbi:MAG: alanine--tRNA ligase [Alphaproteobacteria bacterium]|nr:alanine--tRNA ligase [Alphaproteobacteria bacterium]
MQSANDIRTAFQDYFRSHGHEVVASSPLVPRNDPTLLFTNAGMVQFKNVFTGAEQRPYNQAVTSQKCVRAGGKHNDLENVGYTVRHNTFFEMLGNFSFGDYFKDVAIELAWNLVTREFGLPIEKLLVTVYSEDDEAFGLWQKIAGLPESKIIRIPTSDNFWAMGDTGPCGPCSEIFYDHGPDIPGGPPGSPDEDGDRFIEIWNLVFMQYEQLTADERVDLPRPSIDTGMGLERLTATMQGTNDSFAIDLFRSLIEASAHNTNSDPDGESAVSHRVIADHLRSSSFLIADGVLPSNEGRGYVLRRIMRRAMRHVHLLGSEEPMLWRLVPILVQSMGQAFPELGRAEALITETLRLEESRFNSTLARGMRLLDEASDKLGEGGTLPGDVAFRLYDTYGFPFDLTQDVLRGRGKGVDSDGFEACMARQREDARKAWTGSGEAATETVWFDLRETVGATEFLGYATERAEGVVTAIVTDGAPVELVEAGADAAVIVSQTPFYGESGGQVGDTGILFAAGGMEFAVSDTQKKLDDMHIHLGTVRKGTLQVGDAVELHVEGGRRTQLRANHSVTHLMHEALRRALGDHVTQKGSLVASDYLRFDFSHPKPVSDAELTVVESAVNERIRGNSEVSTRLMTPDDAVEAGALALFGEKYGDEVRVVAMGEGPANVYSVELCGGTHVSRTGDIGYFRITGESAVAAGVRRIEAVTGAAAVEQAKQQAAKLREAAAALKAAPNDLPERIAGLVEERRRLEREVSELRRQVAMGGGGQADEAPKAKDVGGVALTARTLDGVPAKELKPLVDSLKSQIGSGVVAVVSVIEGKASLVVGVTDDLTAQVSAVDLVRAGSAAVGGKGGGGRPDMAQAGGPEGAAADKAIAAIEAALADRG